MRKLLKSMVFMILLSVIPHDGVGAQCPDEKFSNNLSAYALVFTGEVIDLKPQQARFKVARVWKGDLSNEIRIEWFSATKPEDLYYLANGRGEISDELGPVTFRKAEHYLVYAF